MSARSRRHHVLTRVRTLARDAAADRFGAEQRALAVAERAMASAEARSAEAAARARSAREELAQMAGGQSGAVWRGVDAWAARLASERVVVSRLAEVLRGRVGQRAEAVESARRALHAAHRTVEVVQRLAARQAARDRQIQEREDEP